MVFRIQPTSHSSRSRWNFGFSRPNLGRRRHPPGESARRRKTEIRLKSFPRKFMKKENRTKSYVHLSRKQTPLGAVVNIDPGEDLEMAEPVYLKDEDVQYKAALWSVKHNFLIRQINRKRDLSEVIDFAHMIRFVPSLLSFCRVAKLHIRGRFVLRW